MSLEDLMNSRAMRNFVRILILMGGAVAVIGVVLKLLSVVGAANLMVAGFGTLAVALLFLNALFPYKVKDDNLARNMRVGPIWNFAMRSTGMSLAALMIGVLFALLHWPGGKSLLLVGAAALVFSGLIWIYYLSQRNQF